MGRYVAVALAIITVFLAVFLLAEALPVPFLTDPMTELERGGLIAAAVGIGLLVADAVLPVPSSLVMVAHGTLFGVVLGSLLSLVGSTGALLLAFAIGRRGGSLLSRLVAPAERARADALLARWGALAIIVTRPVPILAETVAVLAGASPLGWGRLTLAALLGSMPGAVLYALAGAMVRSFSSAVVMFGLTMVIAAAFWVGSRWVQPSLTRRASTSTSRRPVP